MGRGFPSSVQSYQASKTHFPGHEQQLTAFFTKGIPCHVALNRFYWLLQE